MSVSLSSITGKDSAQILALSGKEAGWFGATQKVFTHPKGFCKMIATIADAAAFFVEKPLLGAISQSFGYVGGVIGAFPETIEELSSGLKGLYDGKRGSKVTAQTLKGFAGVASVPPTLVKMNIIGMSTLAVKSCNVAKSLLEVVSAVCSVSYEFFVRPGEIEGELENPWFVSASNVSDITAIEKRTAQAKAVVGLVFYSFLALGTVFAVALSPVAVTSLAVVYTIAVISNIYAGSFKDDAKIASQKTWILTKAIPIS